MREIRAFGIWYAAGLFFIGTGFMPPWGGWLYGVAPCAIPGVLLITWTAWCQFRWQRGSEPAARAALEQALDERALASRDLWVTADGKSRLIADYSGRLLSAGWRIARADTDQYRAVTELGRAPVTTEVFSVNRMQARVPRVVAGAMLAATGERDSLTKPEPGLRLILRGYGLIGPAAPHPGLADAAEMRELAEQVRTAVLIPVDDE